MTRQPVISSIIRSVGHDPLTKTMHIEFKDGDVYSYEGVEVHHHDGLIRAPSVGGHFHKHIKGRHPARKL